MPRIWFEDITPGTSFEYGAYDVTREETVAFAAAFDPQPFHLDEAAGAASLLGALSTSGWHNAGILMRLTCEGWLNAAASLGSPGLEEVRWIKPVRPGDTLSARATVLETRALASRPGVGLARFDLELRNQRGETAMTQRGPILFARREAAPPAPGLYDRPPSGAPMALPEAGAPVDFPLLYDEMEPGRSTRLGSWRVGADEIVAFAKAYDPQPFHVDAAAAAASPFGRLSASGWHTGSQWMRRMIDARQASAAARLAAGRPAPMGGPSPGFRDIKWPRPVYAGDEISYWTQCLERRTTSRPGWGLVTHRNGAVNQHGDLVLEFTSAVFTPL